MLSSLASNHRSILSTGAGFLMLVAPLCAQETEESQVGQGQQPAAEVDQDPADVQGPESSDSDSAEPEDQEPEPEFSDEELVEQAREDLEEALPSLDEAVPFKWTWKNVGGMITGSKTFTALDDRVRFRLGTTVQLDVTTGKVSSLVENAYGDIDSSLEARRFRFSGHGSYKTMDFKVDLELGANPGLRDAWMENLEEGLSIWGADLGKFRLGQTKEPFSFERQTSGSFTDFLERALPVQTFAPGHNVGGMVHGSTDDKRQTWALGVFSLGQTTEENASSSLFSITGRWSGLAFYEDEGRKLLHMGASFSTRNPGGNEVEYSARPEARYVDPMAATGPIDASDVLLLGAEIAAVYGPWWGQAEFVQTRLRAPVSGNPWFDGGYAQVGYSFMQASRPYRTGGGVFDRFRPELETLEETGLSALQPRGLEVVGRVSNVDLNDGPVQGGKLLDYSLALNWYATRATRVQFNYIYASPSTGGAANIFLLRLQYSPW